MAVVGFLKVVRPLNAVNVHRLPKWGESTSVVQGKCLFSDISRPVVAYINACNTHLHYCVHVSIRCCFTFPYMFTYLYAANPDNSNNNSTT